MTRRNGEGEGEVDDHGGRGGKGMARRNGEGEGKDQQREDGEEEVGGKAGGGWTGPHVEETAKQSALRTCMDAGS